MLTKLTFTKRIKLFKDIKGGRVMLTYRDVVGLPFADEEPLVLGIDPGKYFGMALIGRGVASVISGTLDDTTMPLRECAFLYSKYICEIERPEQVVIEGASYNERYGQVKLAEIRCGFSLGASDLGIPVKTVPPKKPRKIVFGNGDIGAMNVWVDLNHNAADALCLALMPHYEGRRSSDEIQGVVSRRHK